MPREIQLPTTGEVRELPSLLPPPPLEDADDEPRNLGPDLDDEDMRLTRIFG